MAIERLFYITTNYNDNSFNFLFITANRKILKNCLIINIMLNRLPGILCTLQQIPLQDPQALFFRTPHPCFPDIASTFIPHL
jgi:hypothetical protein